MAMTLRLTDQEHDDLRELAIERGISMQEVARLAIREYIVRSDHQAKVGRAAELIMSVHADALDRLGQ
jgi:predicted transcriptional regulator